MLMHLCFTEQDLEKALRDTLTQTITEKDIANICRLVELSDEALIEYSLFAGLAAMAERMIYPKFA